MKRILKYILMFLGVVLLLVVLAGGYLFFFTPIGDILKSSVTTPASVTGNGDSQTKVSTDGIDKNPLLDEGQEAALERIGIDPAKLPSTITSEMESCFIEKLGSERVKEIQAGDTPSAVEFFRAQSCL